MAEQDNPYAPPETPAPNTDGPDGESKAAWPVRVFFGVLALGFVYSLGIIKVQSNTIGVVIGPLVFAFLAFECTHVAVIGSWYGVKQLRRALNWDRTA